MQSIGIETILSRYNLSAGEFLFICIALLFFTLGFLFVVAIFCSRIIKSNNQQREQWLRERYQKILNKVIINESFSIGGQPISAFGYRMEELQTIMGQSNFNRQVLIDQILDIKKNLFGGSAGALIATYHELALYRLSLKKLKSLFWKERALGMRELGEMGYKKSIPQITRFLNDRNETLRQESIMALIRLDEEHPLLFLDNYTGDITPWLRINIFHFLSKLDLRKLPDFSRWFAHSNKSVSLFSINMARQFRQMTAVPALTVLLSSSDPETVEVVVETLGELEAYQAAADVMTLFERAWHNNDLSQQIVRCLAKIGDPVKDVPFIGKFLEHVDYDVRLEAARALKSFGPTGVEFLEQFNERNDNCLRAIINHIGEPLLS